MSSNKKRVIAGLATFAWFYFGTSLVQLTFNPLAWSEGARAAVAYGAPFIAMCLVWALDA